MKFFKKYGSRRNEIRRAQREFYNRLAIAGFVVFFFVVMFLFTRLGPQADADQRDVRTERGRGGEPLSNPALIKLREEVARLEEAFRLKQRSGPMDLADMSDLEQAIELQRQIIRQRGSEIAPLQDVEKLEELMEIYDRHMGEFLRAQSDRLEAEATQSWELDRQAEAVEKLNTAINLQRQINEDYPRSDARSTSRLRQLEARALGWVTRPMAQEIDVMKDRAVMESRAGEFDRAMSTIEEALQKQAVLNREYRESRFASVFRIRELEDVRRNIALSRDLTAVRELFGQAQRELDEGQADAAIDRIEEAEALLQRVASTYPQEREQYLPLMAQVQVFRDTAASRASYQRIAELEEEVRIALQEKELRGLRNQLSELLRLSQEIERQYPRSEYLAQIDLERIRYLHNNRESIPAVMEVVYAGMAPIPGLAFRHLATTEVSQALYDKLVGANPSQNLNPQMPVDSVTWTEARTFVRLLSWILARPVQLPTREDVVAALGVVPSPLPSEMVWSMENTDRVTQAVGTSEPNQFGFHDLLGNVAEWLDAGGNNAPERVVAFGGAARDSRTRLQTVPEEARAPSERNRFIGFRFLVNMEPQLAGR